MKVRDIKAHLDAQIGTASLEGFVDGQGGETKAQAFGRFLAEIGEMRDGEQITKKLQGEIEGLFPAAVEVVPEGEPE